MSEWWRCYWLPKLIPWEPWKDQLEHLYLIVLRMGKILQILSIILIVWSSYLERDIRIKSSKLNRFLALARSNLWKSYKLPRETIVFFTEIRLRVGAEQGSANYTQCTKPSPEPVFIKKVLLETFLYILSRTKE